MSLPVRTTAEVWVAWGRLYPLYSTMARELVIELQPCLPLEEGLETPGAELVSEVEQWFEEMDGRIRVHQLRQFAQTSMQMDAEALAHFVLHHLNKKVKTDADRDKVDFLLVQLFSQVAPLRMRDAELTVDTVAKNLELVLGSAEGQPSEGLQGLNDLLGEAMRAKSLNALFTSRVIERSREIKVSCGDGFFEPYALAAFTRFGFLIRRTFFRLMHQDLNVILDGLRELEARGVETLDCRRAQFSATEPINRLRMICGSWRVMFQAEYSAGQPLCLLVDLRTAVEAGLEKSGSKAKGAASE